ISCAKASVAAAVLYARSLRIIRLARSHPGTINVAATQIAAYISFGVEPCRTMSASDVNTVAGSTREPGGKAMSVITAPDFHDEGRWAAAGSRCRPPARSGVDHLTRGGVAVEGGLSV